MDNNSNRGVNDGASTSREDPKSEPLCKKCRSETRVLPRDGQHSTMGNTGSRTFSIDTASSEQSNVRNTVNIENNVLKQCTLNFNQGGSHSQNTTSHANEKFEYCLPQSEVIGRDEEANELLELVKTHRRVVIAGMSGTGKSSLAAHCARTCTFIRNAIFIDAETDDRVKSAFNSLGLKLDIQNIEKLEQRVQVETIYENFKDTATLVIFDNVTHFSTIRAYLPPKGKDNFYVIITAQLREFGKVFYIYDMPLMSKHSSLKLIEIKFADDWDRMRHEKEEIETLIEKMQSQPLAIIQAVTYISDQLMYQDSEYTVQEYLDEFEKSFKSIEFGDYWDNEYRYKSVYTALVMNMKMVKKDKEFGDKAESVLHCMAFLDPSDIRKHWFLDLYDSKDTLNAVIRLLRKYSLIGIETQYIECITIHRLVQQTSQCMLMENVQTLKLVVRNTLKFLINNNIFYDHRHFIVPHLKDFKLSDFNECYSEVNSSGRCRNWLTYVLGSVNCEYSAVEGWTAAHYAAFDGDIHMLKLLKKRGQSFSVVSQQHWTVLHACCVGGYTDDYVIGLEKSNLNKQTRDQNTALHIVLMRQDCDSALNLIASGCDVTLTNKDGNTAAHLAARYRHVEVLNRLLQTAGVDITQRNNEGRSVSTLAEESHVVIYRHTSQPPAEERVWYRCIYLETPETLEAAVEELEGLVQGGWNVPDGVYQDIVQLLYNIPHVLRLAAGYMRLRNIPPTTFKHYFTTLPTDTVPSSVRDSWCGYCPTNIYILFCDVLNYLIKEHKCAFELLSYMSYVEYTSKAEALTNDRYSEEDIDASRKILDILSLWDPDIQYRSHKLFERVIATYSQMRGEERAVCTAVIKHIYSDSGKTHAVRVLGESGVLASYREVYNSVPDLVQNVTNYYTHDVMVLDVGDLDQWSALHWAVHCGKYTVAQELLLLGVPPDTPADDSVTPLHLAALHCNFDITKLLCVHGARVNASTARQRLTPLHLAAFGRNKENTDYLISQGANENVRDSAGRTPDDIYTMTLPTDSSEK